MNRQDINRIKFYSKQDMAGPIQLSKAEHILRGETQINYSNINDTLEIYNIKKYFDNELYLLKWTEKDVIDFKQKITEFSKAVGQFFLNINNANVIDIHEELFHDYVNDFWELVNNQSAFKRITKDTFKKILSNNHYIIHSILFHKRLVDYYDVEIKNFLMTYAQSAEILLSSYEVQDHYIKEQKFIPKSLSIVDKENIISNYLDLDDANLNYVKLIENVRNRSDFRISDKTRLKAKRLHRNETEKFFEENEGWTMRVSISFPEGSSKIKDGYIDDNSIANYSYSLDYIKQNNGHYLLFQNFKLLFEYTDWQNLINLVSKKSQMDVLERVLGVHSQNLYRTGTAFSISEITSQGQIIGYNKIVSDLGKSLEEILHFVFTIAFQEKYRFAKNARFSIPTASSYFEKVRLLAPEFESVLKQFRLFVEDGDIDFELLQISSSPTSLRDIPSLNQNKYIYFNTKNQEMRACSNIFFSDQTLLAYVEPFKEKKYRTFFDLLANELVVYNNYEEYQRLDLDYLIKRGFIIVDESGHIQVTNPERVLIFKDLDDNECASFYHYSINFQKEVQKMASENIITFGSTLFSKPEQAYFNYYLNKSEFTNGLDLRNSYLHGTQANPEEIQKHENSYFTYMKLLVLAMLKIEDDLFISSANKKSLKE